MKILNVPDMHCEKCVARISKALTNENIAFEISLKDKTVSVDETKISEAVDAIDNLGFEVQQ